MKIRQAEGRQACQRSNIILSVFHFSFLIFISNIKAEGLWGGARPPDIVWVNSPQPSEFVSFFHAIFYSILGAIWEPVGSRSGSPNRPREPSETCLETDFEKSSISDPILGRFFIVFSSIFKTFFMLSTTSLAAFLQKDERQSDWENTMFCD